MHLEDFNTMTAPAARDVVRPCADVPVWVDAVVAARPYADVPALLAYADERAAAWSGVDVERALADHPRIGERHDGDGASATMSASEQSGVDPHDVEVTAALAAGNRRYEETFGRIFLVRAAGRSAEEILLQLHERLAHDPDTELAVTAGELREIAALRLEAVFS